jgi:ABC-type dipeptide/oligopeptide/nickel transport system ATPase component
MPAVFQTDLSVDYRSRPGVLRDVRIRVEEGEILGLVGQSGSGKTTFVMAALGLLDPREGKVTGSVVVNGTELRGMRERELRSIRGKLVSLVPQSPSAALNPAVRIGTQFREAWLAHGNDWRGQGQRRACGLLEACGLTSDNEFLRRYPHQISVGQAQRVLIAMALLHDPVLVIADEPTSALDLVMQREILDLLVGISSEPRRSMIFISHDLQAVASLCNRIAILHEGTIVEHGATLAVLSSPVHPYTKLLLTAVPRPILPECRI